MARVDVIMPQMGESIAEGTVSRWLKNVGDAVKRDEAILEISTDKVDAEIPSPAAGVLAEIKVEEGQTVEVQTVIAVIETDGAAAAVAGGVAETAVAEVERKEAPATAAVPAPPPPAPPPGDGKEAPATAAVPAPPPPPTPAPPPGDGKGGVAESAEGRLRRRSTPLVRRIAAEHNVDIARIEGTGYAGRVTKRDILAHIEGGTRSVAPAAAPAAAAAPATPPAAVEHPTVEPWPGDEVVPMSRIRKLTADHMVVSRRVSAHVTSFYEVDYSRIAQLRQETRKEYDERGTKLTFLAFIIKAVADNLRKHRIVNSSASGDNIIYRRPINIGVAVALDWGLIVPVLKNADELSLLGIAKRVADLAERARTKRLSPDEVQHGTFTITNPGVFGSYAGAPIINQPQVAILGVGSIEKRPKVITLDDGQDVIAIRTMGLLSLSYDHRIVDGADADRFMADLKRDLEQFSEAAV
ncbi:MAG: 2-oxoglutarate dehydrogenase, E2 component, dihydrolipoamide succinyltransferase [Gemmatimonadales bacterium]|nr:2-oxoglutarate dehydrogenase, E2 component, dihydrolipoamide succinyltransferase [Gemmatimonadales bacterium]NIN13541.1 2-oxoglutarate dehydrogenase, E2 component, dihydrolipoamide succinyltransferase [Gemmatimonadales bacterium]NIN51535.1 2-oxoglutarate dehydrogenase, E2 component, dihydrolipoamide succinyltransferase [Gemmatimonadales bacterium]NIP08999.1 2-oxoglutarate dehydrogenase, E2 component, dihydrolipoamide succinyltransferase [Gemmatimonadales bacterium]NIR03777.1 2-oxoglutarate d